MEVKIFKGPGSFKKEIAIELGKDLILIYGDNGSGKTILSDFFLLRQRERERQAEKERAKEGHAGKVQEEAKVPDPYVTTGERKLRDYTPNSGDEESECYVYNPSFIRDNFYEKRGDEIPGIFTLGTDQVGAEKKIKEARDRIEDLSKELRRLEKLKRKVRKEQKDKKDAIIKKVWEEVQSVKNKYINLKFCVEGYISGKEAFFEKFKEEINKEFEQRIDEDFESTISKDLESDEALRVLNQEAGRVKDIAEDEKDEQVLPPSFEAGSIEESPLFQQPIADVSIGSRTILVNKLKDPQKYLSWMKEGVGYAGPPGDPCPLCLQALTKGILKEMDSYLEQDYAKKSRS